VVKRNLENGANFLYSISEVASLSDVTSRTLRHYEEKGLIRPCHRSSNGYRHYSKDVLIKIVEIKKLKQMKFSLDEIKSFLLLKEEGLPELVKNRLHAKVQSIDNEIQILQNSKKKVENQLLATNQFLEGKDLGTVQRRILMETIKKEILENLKQKKEVSQRDLDYLKREEYLFDTPEKREFIEGVKRCLDFAEHEGIKIGPARGASPALLSLYALGWSNFDPSEYGLVPERFSATDFDLHIDVEFKNGKKFIDYCKAVSSKLKIGKIEAFRLPILDIIDRVHARLPVAIDYEKISNDDPIVLDVFRNGDIEKIFAFDFPQETLMAKYFDNNYYKNGKATEMLSDYLKLQEIRNFKDLLNIESIFRPDNLDKKLFMREYIDRYPKAKLNQHTYKCLTYALNEYLKPNYGVIIYQEDIIHIIREYTSWSYEKCNSYRKLLSQETITENQKNELKEYTGDDVLKLLIKESPVVFCKAHSVGAWALLIKKTAVLKTLHKEVYYSEIKKWESENDYSWGDFGFISGGVSLLQQ
jgi:DNA-binding transcriptional MerR regulator